LIKVAGLTFNDPLIIPSGIIPITANYINYVCKEYKPSAITLKTLTLSPLEPHKPPTIVKFHDGCYINAIGLGNPGVKVIDTLNNIDCKLIGSVGGKDVKEFVEVAKYLENKVVILELNISSPNRPGYGLSLISDAQKIVSEVKAAVRKPVFVKLGPMDNILEIVGKLLESGADGFSLINTLRGTIIDIDTFKPILSFGSGGISGKCIFPLALRIIRDVYSEYNVDIIGMGGVFSWEDVISMMAVGAKLVGLGTVIIDKGLSIINTIRNDLFYYLREKGLNFQDIIGIAVKK
jgi:dihydroorotate dehydrogenase (fumarate)